MISRQILRWVGLPTGVAIVAALLVVVAPPATAVPTMHLVTRFSNGTRAPEKTVEVPCPTDMQVVGGGGQISVSRPEDESKVVLTRLFPVEVGVTPWGTISGKYVVTAHEAGEVPPGDWRLFGYAVCASGPREGYRINFNDRIPTSSQTVQESLAGCGNDDLMIGAGGELRGVPGAQATLQLARSSGQRGDFRTVGKEDANGFGGNWLVVSHAICIDPVTSMTVRDGQPTALNSQDVKTASVSCQLPGFYVHGTGAVTAGASGPGTAPGGVALTAIVPSDDLKSVTVRAVETTPAGGAWSLAAQASCVVPSS